MAGPAALYVVVVQGGHGLVACRRVQLRWPHAWVALYHLGDWVLQQGQQQKRGMSHVVQASLIQLQGLRTSGLPSATLVTGSCSGGGDALHTGCKGRMAAL